MTSFPFEFDNLIIKFIVMSVNMPFGMLRGCNNPKVADLSLANLAATYELLNVFLESLRVE